MARSYLRQGSLLATLLLAVPLLLGAGLAAGVAAAAPAPAGATAAAPAPAPVDRKDIENEVNCPCEDNCGKLLANCICGFSNKLRKEIDGMIAAGMTKPEILQALVKRFGIRVLAKPGTSNWLDRLSWIAPFLALALGGLWVVRIARRFVTPAGETAPPAPEPPPPAAAGDAARPSYERRLEEELSRFEP